MKAYTLFPGIAMVVVDGFYSIVKLVFIVIKGFTKPNSYSNAGAAEDRMASKPCLIPQPKPSTFILKALNPKPKP